MGTFLVPKDQRPGLPEIIQVKNEVEPGANLGMSAAAKEESMAAMLEDLRSNPRTDSVSQSVVPAGRAPPRRDRPAPVYARPGRAKATDAAAAGGGVSRFVQLDGLQRVCLGAVVVLGSVAYGRSTPELLDTSAVATLQLAFLAAAASSLGLAAYGAFVIAPRVQQPPAPWFFKLAFTSVGGLAELTREADTANET